MTLSTDVSREIAHRGFPVPELIDDLRMAYTSRFLDDREIALQKQSRVFFQISGAGHEALLLGLGRELRPALRLVLPVLPGPGAHARASASRPRRSCWRRSARPPIPASGGRQMSCHWGNAAPQHRHPVEPDREPVPAGGRLRRGQLATSPAATCPGCVAHGDELTYVSLGEGATSEGEFWESLNTACTLHLPVLYVVADNGFAISVPSVDQSPAPVSELVRGFRGLHVHQLDGRDYFEVRARAPDIVAEVRAGVGPALIHATVTRPYSHSSQDTQSKYRSPEELAEEADPRPARC